MCTRILNNINKDHITVGRNMDWEFSLEPTIIINPAHGRRIGMSEAELDQINQHAAHQLKKTEVLEWEVNYATVSTLIGNISEGYGFCDGMNDQGLVANALYDTNCSFAKSQEPQQKGLSVLRWGQYILDSFATVPEAVESLSKNTIYLYGGKVPGDENSPATLHLSISDRKGKSAILEVKNSEVQIYCHENYTVMTNQPDYKTQLKMMDYWLYQWNKPDIFSEQSEALEEAAEKSLDDFMKNIRNPHPVFSVPGGYTSVQRFERGCFYRYMYNPQAQEVDPVAQVRAMVATCIVPVSFEELYPINLFEKLKKKLGYSVNSYTLWSNISDSTQRRYYYMSNEMVQTVWFDIDNEPKECKKLVINSAFKASHHMGPANQVMEPCKNAPFY
ncbi:linear amide C-N hydrolase [Vibrio gazogenes]|uniref:Choloylglycine hydrolase n=1 Tax=Vibrio gazogenes DSM 21264 = NBRC 103151 TaxID=1123492 RepID=A0A1M4T2P3_VIBGA|nr:linear amide C-N hydrolase [Vibrio gazogenes]SHE38567.1 choloylglycine hydrolase [Vibrio gazogenes DSM 21264] [Vibrio gazogenes DSM 21264 = NBRC 103151]SJN54691.1 Linear amide C-N hydrolases, choloylglycine hydrolase family [Vibrio gazogenes]